MTETLTETWHARYRAGVRDYLDASPAPLVDDEPCTTCAAAAGQACTTGDGWRCVSRVVDHLERVDLHRVAAHTAGLRAAQTTSATRRGPPQEGTSR